VWLTKRYSLDWFDGARGYGSAENGIVRAVPGGFEVVGGTRDEKRECHGDEHDRETVTNYRVVLLVDSAGTITQRDKVVTNRYEVADPCHPLGRRPSDFVDIDVDAHADAISRAMHHEAESVRAFERIARELTAHGAPSELVRAALQAAEDERDHAWRWARLAGTHPTIAHDNLPVRSLVELAIDNAREGCAGEAYAALSAAQSARSHPVMADHYAAIAIDELSHAALAYAIADWLDEWLTQADRERVRAARDAALAALPANALGDSCRGACGSERVRPLR